MKIGRYQLENLIGEGIRFLFIDLRTPAEREEISDALFEKAMPLVFNELVENLTTNEVSVDSPILLMDQTGETVDPLVQDLEELGYKNVYVVRGGAREIASPVH